MELRELRYFRIVVESGSFSKAAVKLMVAQPSLSRQIRALEDKLGMPLLRRNARGVSPTEAGKVLLERTLRLEEDMGGFGGGARIGGLGGDVPMGERMGGFGGDVGVGGFDGAARIGGLGDDRFVGSRLHEHDMHRFDRISPDYDPSCDLDMQDPTYPLPPYCD